MYTVWALAVGLELSPQAGKPNWAYHTFPKNPQKSVAGPDAVDILSSGRGKFRFARLAMHPGGSQRRFLNVHCPGTCLRLLRNCFPRLMCWKVNYSYRNSRTRLTPAGAWGRAASGLIATSCCAKPCCATTARVLQATHHACGRTRPFANSARVLCSQVNHSQHNVWAAAPADRAASAGACGLRELPHPCRGQ
jgi:hypothetical protein